MYTPTTEQGALVPFYLSCSYECVIDYMYRPRADARAMLNMDRGHMDKHELLLKYLEMYCNQPCNETGVAFSLAYHMACHTKSRMWFVEGSQQHYQNQKDALMYIRRAGLALDKKAHSGILRYMESWNRLGIL